MKYIGVVVVAVVLAFSVFASGCTKQNPAYCENNSDCVGQCLLNRCEETLPDANLACTMHEQCAGICDGSGMCVDCAGADCEMRTDGRAVCDQGRCVECVVSDDCTDLALPACVQNVCEKCTAHEQCEQRTGTDDVGLCDETPGSCVTRGNVLVVDINDNNCDNNLGLPYCEISSAATDISDDNTGGISDVVVMPGTYRAFTVTADMRIVGTDQETVIVDANNSTAAVEITNGAVVEIRRMTLRGATNGSSASGVWCRGGATCTLSQLIATLNSVGIRADNAVLFLHRSTVELNVVGGGIDVSIADFEIINNVIMNNGSFNSQFGGVRLGADAGGVRVFSHNTLFSNNRPNNTSVPGGVSCAQSTTLSSNVFWGNAIPEAGALCQVEYSVIEDATIGAMNNNVMGDPLLVSTSNPFDMHIGAGSSAIDTGDPNGTILYDIDGEVRADGLPDIGSDER